MQRVAHKTVTRAGQGFPDVEGQRFSFDGLTIADLHALSNSDGISPYNHLRRRINRMIAHAHLDPSPLLFLLQETGSVISGLSVLAVMVPCGVLGSNLDIFCTSSHVKRLSDFLEDQGYHPFQFLHQKESSVVDHGSNAVPSFIIPLAVECIYAFQNSDASRTVSLVCSASQSPLAPILGYPTTALMNWVDGTGVGCAYPELTRLGEGDSRCMSAAPKLAITALKTATTGVHKLL
ncbi:hypothetical protein BKA70DRAFT_1239691 [Coprinopsis sp. MPI-PUGE-AT-0042]|nr:hypothetical protein BKA70DRAFT_1239691 [Coprinopsis sp. MPI-PUGE-AT-0042]